MNPVSPPPAPSVDPWAAPRDPIDRCVGASFRQTWRNLDRGTRFAMVASTAVLALILVLGEIAVTRAALSLLTADPASFGDDATTQADGKIVAGIFGAVLLAGAVIIGLGNIAVLCLMWSRRMQAERHRMAAG